MMHKAWSSIEVVPYCFSRSYIKLQGHMAKKIDDYDPNLKPEIHDGTYATYIANIHYITLSMAVTQSFQDGLKHM